MVGNVWSGRVRVTEAAGSAGVNWFHQSDRLTNRSTASWVATLAAKATWRCNQRRSIAAALTSRLTILTTGHSASVILLPTILSFNQCSGNLGLFERRLSNIADCWVTAVAPRPTQPSIPPGSANPDQFRLGRQRQVCFISFLDKRVGGRWNCEISWQRVPYLSASVMRLPHKEPLYQVYTLPFSTTANANKLPNVGVEIAGKKSRRVSQLTNIVRKTVKQQNSLSLSLSLSLYFTFVRSKLASSLSSLDGMTEQNAAESATVVGQWKRIIKLSGSHSLLRGRPHRSLYNTAMLLILGVLLLVQHSEWGPHKSCMFAS